MAKVTMKDIAKHSGVSVATVSNVLNDIANKTTKLTRQRVLASANELGYKTSQGSRHLSIVKSNLIGIILPETYENSTPSTVLKGNPFYSEVLSGIEYQVRMSGYDVLISCVRDASHVLELVDKRLMDGMVIVGNYPDGFWDQVLDANIPIVLVDNYDKLEGEVCNVGVDDELGAYLATKHLITLGHKQIALGIGEIGESEVNEKRYAGNRRALKESGLDLSQCPVVTANVSFRGGATVGHRILKDHTEVTAIFASADIMAMGIIKTMNQFGKSIPEDLSVIGFDDLSICEYMSPALTTIRQDIYRKGLEAARILLKRVDGISSIGSQTLPVELIVRDTTRMLRD